MKSNSVVWMGVGADKICYRLLEKERRVVVYVCLCDIYVGESRVK